MMDHPASTPLAARHRLHRVIFVVLLALAVSISVQTVFFDHRPRVDLAVFLTAGNDVLAGRNPYDPAGASLYRYHYPQAFAWFIAAPLSAMGVRVAEVVWGAASLGFLGFSIFAAIRAANRLTGDTSPQTPDSSASYAWVMAAAAAVSFPPVWFGWRIGQADLLITAILALMMVGDDKRRPWIAGLAVGLAAIFKVSPVVLLPALVLAFGWRCAAGFAAVVGLYLLVVFSTGNLDREIYFFTDRIDYWKFNEGFPACSLSHLLGVKLFPGLGSRPGYYESWLTTALTVFLLAGYAVSGLFLWKRRAPWHAQLFLGIAISHLVSPFFEPQHATLLILPLAFLTYQADLRRSLKLALWCTALWLPGMAFESGYSFGGYGWSSYLLLISDVVLIGWTLRVAGPASQYRPG